MMERGVNTNGNCRLVRLVVSGLVGCLLMASSATGDVDGIDLVVTRGALPGECLLTWTGGSPPFHVFRSTDPDVPDLIGDPTVSNWLDTPPPAVIHYYHIIERSCPPAGSLVLSDCRASGAVSWTRRKLWKR